MAIEWKLAVLEGGRRLQSMPESKVEVCKTRRDLLLRGSNHSEAVP